IKMKNYINSSVQALLVSVQLKHSHKIAAGIASIMIV
ncbi:Dihydroxy-acid dehydratase, partial [Haemophilus influenzae]